MEYLFYPSLSLFIAVKLREYQRQIVWELKISTRSPGAQTFFDFFAQRVPFVRSRGPGEAAGS